MTEFFCEMTEAFCKLSRCQVGKPFVAIRRVTIFASASSVEAALTAVRDSDIVDQDSVVHVYTKLLSRSKEFREFFDGLITSYLIE